MSNTQSSSDDAMKSDDTANSDDAMKSDDSGDAMKEDG